MADNLDPFADESAPWRRCEVAWGRWLESAKYAVDWNCNRPAPMFTSRDQKWRLPDFEGKRGGKSRYWEVKYRTSASVDPVTSEREHWMSHACYEDYLKVANATGCPVDIVLYEAPTATSPGRWLKIGIDHLRVAGRKEMRFGSDGEQIEARVWSRRAMDAIDGPEVDLAGRGLEPLPNEGEGEPLEPSDLVEMERIIRRNNEPDPVVNDEGEGNLRLLLESERLSALSVLSGHLGLPVTPRYSVLRVGLGSVDVDDLLGFMQYGIRVFLVAERDMPEITDDPEVAPYLDSRLLEVAVAPAASTVNAWVVDGHLSDVASEDLEAALDEADRHGGINVLQYRIVHAPQMSDVRVVAGAGTGKTETMSERVMFLLATVSSADDGTGTMPRPYDLRVDDIVMVTFTRESAREMRERIARTLMLRQRLCRRCTLPVLAWMMQLSSTQISTIHGFAKSIAQQGAASLGIGPGFRVSQQTLVFREIVLQALSARFNDAVEAYGGSIPKNHLWVKHIQEVWNTLDNAGVSLVDMRPDSTPDIRVDWGSTSFGDYRDMVAAAIEGIIEEVAGRFAEACREEQSVPTSQLVTLALQTMTSQDSPPVRRPRFLFIDEFQDTDSQQMDFIIALRKKMGARLFVVGDVKQGIYRFRGAEGSAFVELEARRKREGLGPFLKFSLTRNFRSGRKLLESLHPYFEVWGSGPKEERLLDYGPTDKLRHARHKTNSGLAIQNRTCGKWVFAAHAADQVKAWRTDDSDPPRKIAILCRYNSQARAVQKALRGRGLQCDLVSKGEFYTTPAVREMRVLLEAVNNPNDTAALLELLETRWSTGVCGEVAPVGLVGQDFEVWKAPVGDLLAWEERWTSLPAGGNFETGDLRVLRGRVSSLRRMLDGMSLMGWITECARVFGPELCMMDGDDELGRERERYSRCLGHLLMKMDTEFGDAPVTLVRALEWLELQIATNDSEDEPFEEDDLEGITVAITVHKAKGLEFDCVLVPNTWQEWGTVPTAQSHAAVLRDESDADALPRLGWKWKGETQNFASYTNMDLDSDAGQKFWAEDLFETEREETRLLYVALTRARDHLVVFRLEEDSGSTWGALLARGEEGR